MNIYDFQTSKYFQNPNSKPNYLTLINQRHEMDQFWGFILDSFRCIWIISTNFSLDWIAQIESTIRPNSRTRVWFPDRHQSIPFGRTPRNWTNSDAELFNQSYAEGCIGPIVRLRNEFCTINYFMIVYLKAHSLESRLRRVLNWFWQDVAISQWGNDW